MNLHIIDIADGRENEPFDLVLAVGSIEALREQLKIQKDHIILCNGVHVSERQELRDGDTITVLPLLFMG